MNKKEIQEFLKPLNKDELREVINAAETQLNYSMVVGDSVTLVIDYMIGDADGDTEAECCIEIETQDELDALHIIQDILDNHTEPNNGRWGFLLDSDNFSKKHEDVFNILYNQKNAPENYNGIKLNTVILKKINNIRERCFRAEAEYSFLVYQGYRLEQ